MSSAARAGLPGVHHRTAYWRPALTAATQPGRMLFVNIPVADAERSKAFFAGLGPSEAQLDEISHAAGGKEWNRFNAR